MGVFRRVRDITVANLNERLEQAQDPVRLIDQFLIETRQEITEAERLHHQCASHTRSLKNQVDHAKAMRDKREEQALLALKAEEEHLAKLALQEKMLYEEKLEQYEGLYLENLQSLQELELQISELKTEYQTVYSKRQYYYARMETLRLQQRMNQRSGFGDRDVPKMFGRLEDRMSDMEWEARSLRDLRKAGSEFLNQAGSALQSTLEQEMARLRQKLDKRREE
ncbi:phage shock protein A [Paenibacillus sp. CAA11]|uniref:PspA/IM30 family protein n=1 Tax=Paenibacillus sp. CAA11 TaxID=1532905 RepID=UPI000D3DB863|nr:PspA/IM30 family protein [Paenibacillus sp. CAA11]AWB45945.1 phage shock protein A [Paenibacillus sp. CAA11]